MWQSELHPLDLINVATLRRESQNTKNVSDIMGGILPTKIWGVIQQYVYETNICDIDDLRKRLMQTWFDFD